MGPMDILQPLGIVVGVIVLVAVAYFAGTSIKARLGSRRDDDAKRGSSGSSW